jgi:hypothetical protein
MKVWVYVIESLSPKGYNCFEKEFPNHYKFQDCIDDLKWDGVYTENANGSLKDYFPPTSILKISINYTEEGNVT